MFVGIAKSLYAFTKFYKRSTKIVQRMISVSVWIALIGVISAVCVYNAVALSLITNETVSDTCVVVNWSNQTTHLVIPVQYRCDVFGKHTDYQDCSFGDSGVYNDVGELCYSGGCMEEPSTGLEADGDLQKEFSKARSGYALSIVTEIVENELNFTVFAKSTNVTKQLHTACYSVDGKIDCLTYKEYSYLIETAELDGAVDCYVNSNHIDFEAPEEPKMWIYLSVVFGGIFVLLLVKLVWLSCKKCKESKTEQYSIDEEMLDLSSTAEH